MKDRQELVFNKAFLRNDGFELRLDTPDFFKFGFLPSANIVNAVAENIASATGYSESKGIIPARLAIQMQATSLGIKGVGLNDVYIGNGASDLIIMALAALLNHGDEILLPAPCVDLWINAVRLAGGKPVFYMCREENAWLPCALELTERISSRTKGMVILNPHSPTGVIYPKSLLSDLLDTARLHDLLVFSDESCSRLMYDESCHTALASLCSDVVILTFNSLSLNHAAAGYRAGWMIVSGDRCCARSYVEGLDMLANMKLCSNVPGQWAVTAALKDTQFDFGKSDFGRRLNKQRGLAFDMIAQLPGVSCLKPSAGFSFFPRLSSDVYQITDESHFFRNLHAKTGVAVTPGHALHAGASTYFGMTFLPRETELEEAINRIGDFLRGYQAASARFTARNNMVVRSSAD